MDKLKRQVSSAVMAFRRLQARVFHRRNHRPWDRESVHAYWSNPKTVTPGVNEPVQYLDPDANSRSEFLTQLLNRHLDLGDSILEPGCNAGRNLNHLFENGWTRLAGIEINEEALSLLEATFPSLSEAAELHHGLLEDVLPTLEEFDCVFTMAVLEHVHFDSEVVFDHIANLARKLLVTIEDEQGVSSRHFPRNYRKVFEKRGWTQVEKTRAPGGMPPMFVARVFARVS